VRKKCKRGTKANNQFTCLFVFYRQYVSAVNSQSLFHSSSLCIMFLPLHCGMLIFCCETAAMMLEVTYVNSYMLVNSQLVCLPPFDILKPVSTKAWLIYVVCSL